MIQEIVVQAVYYFIAMTLGVLILGFLLKGFLVPYIRTRLSFGKFVLVKIRSINRDYFRVGWIEEGFLVYAVASKHDLKRLAITDNDVFYNSIGCWWIDVHEQKNCIVKHNFSKVAGFDAQKYNDLYKRALYRPSINENREKVIVGAILLAIVLVVIVGFLVYKNGYSLQFIMEKVSQSGSVVPSGG